MNRSSLAAYSADESQVSTKEELQTEGAFWALYYLIENSKTRLLNKSYLDSSRNEKMRHIMEPSAHFE